MISPSQAVPVRQRLLTELRALIQGHLRPGERLPSVRELTRRHHVSPVTVSAVLAQLAQEGLVLARPGAGTFVAEPPSKALAARPDTEWQTVALASRQPLPDYTAELFHRAPADLISFGNGYLDESLQPVTLLGQSLKRAAQRPDLWGRPPAEGIEALRTWFARQLGPEYRAADVLIFPGAQVALTTLLRALVPAGTPLLVESPTYYGVLVAARSAGIEVVSVPADEGGIRPDLLAQALKDSRARVIYLQPLYANPTGAVLAEERRAAVLQLAEAAGAFVIEDDYARDLHLTGTPPAPLALRDTGRVLYLRSLTKVAAPGLRVAALCGRGAVMARLRQARATESFFMSAVLQETAVQLVTSRQWPAHLKALREGLRLRRDALAQALAQDWPEAQLTALPAGGYNAWLRLPGGSTDLDFTAAARGRGVQVSPGSAYFSAEAPAPFVRLSYAGLDSNLIRQGVAQLGACFRLLYGE